MADYYGYLATVSAVLGGFALTFFGVLLSGAPDRKTGVTAGLSAAATSAFAVTALGWGLAASGLALASADGAARATQFIDDFRPLHRMLSLGLIAGIFLFVGALGLAGWIRSRALGLVTSSLAAVSMTGVLLILRHVVN